MRKKILLPALFLWFATAGLSQSPQSKAQLEKERQEIRRELKEMQDIYTRLKGQTRQSVGQLNILIHQINLREQYISSISKELRNIEDDLYLSEREIYQLNNQLDTLKVQYAKSVVYSYKSRTNYDYVNFIFSASSFNDAVKRIAYLKSYRAYREKQVSTIRETQVLIAQRKKQQLVRKDQKNTVLQSQARQLVELSGEKKEKDAVVAQLKAKEKDLQEKITAKKKRDTKLKNAIVAIIERERVRALEEERKRLAAIEVEKKKKTVSVAGVKTAALPAVKPGTITGANKPVEKGSPGVNTYVRLNANETALAVNFKMNYGKLPWPVDNGVVCGNFGINTIEGTRLKEYNPGITICTAGPGIPVKSVFDGEVLSVFDTGDGMAVMIQHGNFYTIYSNLSSAIILKGAVVKTGQVIGKAGGDVHGGGRVDLILMQDKDNINPRPWLRR